MKKKLDISTQYTKDQNKNCGRNGYGFAHKEKCVNISPAKFWYVSTK